MKICCCCKKKKTKDNFFRDKSRSDGFSYHCKACDKIKSKLFFLKNPSFYKEKYARTKMSRYSQPKTRYNAAKRSSRYNQISWRITFKDYLKVVSKQCVYCGHSLPLTGSGLDRINSNIGYTHKNVVPCCTVCNMIKNNVFTYSEMLLLGKIVRKIRRTRCLQR